MPEKEISERLRFLAAWNVCRGFGAKIGNLLVILRVILGVILKVIRVIWRVIGVIRVIRWVIGGISLGNWSFLVGHIPLHALNSVTHGEE